jgi:hypothetical protein
VLTHLDELCAGHPFAATQEENLASRVMAFVKRAAPLLKPDDRNALGQRLRDDWRLRLAVQAHGAQVGVSVQPDAWVSRRVAVRCVWQQPVRLRVHCRGGWPIPGRLQLTARSAASLGSQTFELDARQSFTLTLSTPAGQSQGSTTWWLEAPQTFVPAEVQPGSGDARELSFRVEGVSIELQTHG